MGGFRGPVAIFWRRQKGQTKEIDRGVNFYFAGRIR